MWVAETDDTYVHRSALGPVSSVCMCCECLHLLESMTTSHHVACNFVPLCHTVFECLLSLSTHSLLYPSASTPHAHTHSYIFCAPAPSASQDSDDAAVLQILNSPFPTPPSLLQIPNSLVSTPVFLHSGPRPRFLHPSPVHFLAATGRQSSGRVHATEGKRLSRWVAMSHRANFHGIMVVLGLVRMIWRCTQTQPKFNNNWRCIAFGEQFQSSDSFRLSLEPANKGCCVLFSILSQGTVSPTMTA